MPAELWAEAVALARTHGVYATARALGVNYQSLATRVAADNGAEDESQPARSGFVELRGVDVEGRPTAKGAEVVSLR